jgi:hypothetical protein
MEDVKLLQKTLNQSPSKQDVKPSESKVMTSKNLPLSQIETS